MNIAKMKVPGAPSNNPARPVEIDPRSFPDQPKRNDGIPATIENVRHMLEQNGVSVRYNVIKKRVEITIPWLAGTPDNADSVSMTHIQSLAGKYNMAIGLVPQLVDALADENSYNPAADWINSRKWDGVDRLGDVYATITVRDDYPVELRDILIKRWLLSATAAAVNNNGFKSRGVLTLQGAQGIGKTSWGLSLINDKPLRKMMIKVDHHLDPSNKDSLLGVIDHWIGEIGELDSTFRRDVARLKGFLTSGSDKIRRPYARVTSEYQRRTVFYATVNASDFLVDDTGNTRFWTIACVSLDFAHGIDMQQVFAQCAVLLKGGEQWWLTPDEERLLEQENTKHRSFSVMRDRLTEIIDLEAGDDVERKAMTASEVLRAAEFDHPSNPQARECAAYLREWFGEPKRINGFTKWRVPIRDGVIEESDEGSLGPRPAKKPGSSKSKFD